MIKNIQKPRTLGEELKRFMTQNDRKISIQQLSKESGISHATISKIINHNLKHRPTRLTYEKLGHYFNVKESYLKSLPVRYDLLIYDEEKYIYKEGE